MSVLIPILITFHVFVCLLMVGVVLMQRPKNEGLGAAFGGGMTENIFGAQTTHVLQKFTVWLGIVFFALTLLLAIIYAKSGTGETAIQKELLAQPVPAAAVQPAVVTPGGETKADLSVSEGGTTLNITEPPAAEETSAPAMPATPEAAATPSPAAAD
jgi:preprotein translocase subunit SecG